MRLSIAACCGAVLVFGAVTSVLGQDEGTCADPIVLATGTIEQFTLDTSLSSNSENDACFDSVATGPDIVFTFSACAGGLVSWDADFDAIVYIRRDSCGSVCEAWSPVGPLEYWSNYRWEYDEDGVWRPTCDQLFVIIDGIEGAAGTVFVQFDYSFANPTLVQTWGRIKSGYR